MPREGRSSAPIESPRVDRLDPMDRIAPNFRVYELTSSEIGDRRRIDNALPSNEVLHAAVQLARQVLQPLRTHYGAFSPMSVYRGQALERALKNRPASWISTSPHTLGHAFDLKIAGVPTKDLADWASRHLPDFDQIVCECHDPRQGPNSGWVHISLRPPAQGRNRRQVLR